MNQIAKTKTTTPIIFDYYSPDKHTIDIGSIPTPRRWRTLAEISAGIACHDKSEIILFMTKRINFYAGAGVMWCGYFRVVVYREDGKLKGAMEGVNSHISTTVRTIINKFFKSYGVKLSNVTQMDRKEFTKKFVIPVSFGMKDYNSDTQKELSSRFLALKKASISVSTEQIAKVLETDDCFF